MQRNDKHKLLKGTILAAALASLPFGVYAAGMGKVTVLSALGQPLRAELDVSGSPDELPSLAARVAPVEAFRQANVEYAAVLATVRFALDKRPNGQPFFKIQTERAVNDPFIDFLVELSWSSGRLVREYAFLLDPPESNVAASAAAPVTPPVAQASTDALQRQPSENMPEVAKAKTKVPIAATKPQTSDEPKGGERTRTVKSGDTLGKIAAESVGEGVSLDQMLVALFNTNREAFDGANMNRLRAGKILSVPDLEQVKALNSSEARKIVVAQSSDFNAYRNHLATATAKKVQEVEAPQQSSSGKITPRVEEKQTVATGKDKLQVSRNEADGKVAKGKAEEDLVARDKALTEANSRIAELEKNLTDLKKLAELKAQPVADTQKPALPAPAVASKDVKGLAVPVTPPVAEKDAVPAAPVAATAPETPVAPKVDEAPKPKPKKRIIAPPSPPPSFVDDNPLLVYGGGAGIAVILGLLGFGFWKRKRDKSREQGITVSDLAANSVFGAAGGQSVDTSAPLSNFAHSTLGAIEHKEGVDPIQEAEVYMAYGRDGQAEEILLDAMQKDPANLAVHLKLLEIYAGRKSLAQFSTVAGDLRTRTDGVGSEWDKAATLGRTIDPSNSLYASGTAEIEHEQTQVMSRPSAEVADMDATMVMSAPVESLATPLAPAAAEPEPEAASAMDFDLDLGAVATPSAEAPEPAVVEGVADAALDMDFDLDLDSGDVAIPEVPVESGNSIDFDIASPSVAAPAISAEPASEEPALDFNFDLGDTSSTSEQAPPLDLSSISLDLDSPALAAASDTSSEVATKLELAQAYEEMGDREGARELLQEVLAEGSQAQQELAKNKLAQLG